MGRKVNERILILEKEGMQYHKVLKRTNSYVEDSIIMALGKIVQFDVVVARSFHLPDESQRDLYSLM